MIHELIPLTRRLIVFDTETTGTNVNEDRIVELGFQVWEATGMTKEWRSLVNPMIRIPEGAAKVHGIDNGVFRLCRECANDVDQHGLVAPDHEFHGWPTFKQIAPNISHGFSDCDFAGKNIRFDLRIMAAEMARSGVTWSYADACIIDIDRLEQIGEPRTLSHLYEKHVGEKLEGAHGALADVQASSAIIAAQLKKYADLPRTLGALHDLQWPNWIDPDGKFKFVNGVPCIGNWGKHALKPMRGVDNGYWDFILKADFSPDVKALASAAKLGQYPQPKRSGNEGNGQEAAE